MIMVALINIPLWTTTKIHDNILHEDLFDIHNSTPPTDWVVIKALGVLTEWTTHKDCS